MDKLTLDEKREILINYCAARKECDTSFGEDTCPLYGKFDFCTDGENIAQKYDLLFGTNDEETEEPQEVENDVIKHPNHYCRDGAMECIDEMVLVFGKEVVKHFALCNIWKYRYRSNDKNGKEDIEKSDQYIRIYKRLCEDGQTQNL